MSLYLMWMIKIFKVLQNKLFSSSIPAGIIFRETFLKKTLDVVSRTHHHCTVCTTVLFMLTHKGHINPFCHRFTLNTVSLARL